MESVLFHGSIQLYIWSAVISAILIWLLTYWMDGRRLKNLTQLPTVEGDLPFVGTFFFVKRSSGGFYKQMSEMCAKFRRGGIYTHRVGNFYYIRVFAANHIEKVLRRHNMIDKGPHFKFLDQWLGHGLLTNNGESWKSRRRILTPSFHFSILNDAVDTMNSHAADFCDLLMRDCCDKHGEKAFDIMHLFSLLSLDIIGETAMGVQMNALHNRESEYIKAVVFTKNAIAERMRKRWLYPDITFKNTSLGRDTARAINFMHQYAYKVIHERRVEKSDASEGKRRHKAFLDTLLDCTNEDGKPLSDETIREEVDTFMFAGHDTMSSALSFATYLLGRHPEKQEKCYQELLTIIESPRGFTTEDLSKMVYLEWCIKESMRLYPPVPLLLRNVAADIELGACEIPSRAGTLLLPLYELHRDPAVFPEPDKFDPTRFSPDNSANRHPYAYIPFSAGPRNCIGQRYAMMELKIVMATMLLKFRIKSVQKESELDLNYAVVVKANNGILVELETRIDD